MNNLDNKKGKLLEELDNIVFVKKKFKFLLLFLFFQYSIIKYFYFLMIKILIFRLWRRIKCNTIQII